MYALNRSTSMNQSVLGSRPAYKAGMVTVISDVQNVTILSTSNFRVMRRIRHTLMRTLAGVTIIM